MGLGLRSKHTFQLKNNAKASAGLDGRRCCNTHTCKTDANSQSQSVETRAHEKLTSTQNAVKEEFDFG